MTSTILNIHNSNDKSIFLKKKSFLGEELECLWEKPPHATDNRTLANSCYTDYFREYSSARIGTMSETTDHAYINCCWVLF